MNAHLLQLFDELEKQRQQLLSEVKSASPDTWHRAPAGKWSVLQILAHLLQAERLSLQYMRKKALGIEQATDAGWWEDVKMLALKISQRLPGLKFRAPRVVVDTTPAYTTLADLERDWDALRNELHNFVSAIPDSYTHRKIYRHVFAGRLSAPQALIFFGEHIVHHLPQIKARLQ
jgi:hypothetical protein